MRKQLLIYFSIIISLFMISSVMALDSLGTFKQGDIVRITQVCSDATWINISSVSYPNSIIAVGNTPMSSAGSGEYYSTFTNTSSLGRYDVRGISNGCEKTFATYFEVTSTGQLQGNNWLPTFLLIGFAVMMALALWQKNEYFGLFSGFLAIVAGVYMMIYGFGIFAGNYTRMMAFIFIGVGVIVSFLSILELFIGGDEAGSFSAED